MTRTLQIEADVIEERDGVLLVSLKTGFGDPELRIDTKRVTVLPPASEGLELACVAAVS